MWATCEHHNTIPALKRPRLVDGTEDPGQRYHAQEAFPETEQTDKHVCSAEDHKSLSKIHREVSGVPGAPCPLSAIIEKMTREDFTTFKRELAEEYPSYFATPFEDLSVCGVVEKLLELFGEQKSLVITQNFLHIDALKKVQKNIKVRLWETHQHMSGRTLSTGKLPLLNEIYTELYITEGGSGQVNNEHEVRQIEMTSKMQTMSDIKIECNDIFKTSSDQKEQIQVVLTKGVAGIGKTVSVQKFILDWAEGKANQHITAIVSLPFRDLNLRKDEYSFIELLHHYAPELKDIKDIEDERVKLLFIFDGLDECRFPLDFQRDEKHSDVRKPASVNVLLTNLIKTNLLPSALLWITSRPAAANQIPPKCVQRVTEIRGFNDCRKEEYFKKKISDQILANRIITHIKSSRSLYIMCHIPVICYLSATVLEKMMSDGEKREIPKTLTEMYTHFLLIQISLKNEKYHGQTTDMQKLSQSDKEMILKLGELAFQQLDNGNLIFYEEDLRKCGIDMNKASEYSSLCTEIFREELGSYREKVFCFVHLSIQEHLAAVYAHVICVNEKTSVFSKPKFTNEEERSSLFDLHRSAVDKALRTKNGQLDLFLRFLLGLCLEPNQILLQDLMNRSGIEKINPVNTILYLKERIKKESSPERILNIFHCLNELNDNSLEEEIQTALRSGSLSDRELRPDQCSALAYVLLMSEKVLEEFDLNMFKTSAVGQQRLLPVLRTCKKARFTGCILSSESCLTVASALKTVNSPLIELDLSFNNLRDSGVKTVCDGLMSPNCKIKILRLNECSVTDGCCVNLGSVLQSPHSNLRELELRNNDIQDSGVKYLSNGLLSQHCKLEKLELSVCKLTEGCCAVLASVLQSSHSKLRQLELRGNDLRDSGIKQLFVRLENPYCKLSALGLGACNLTDSCCINLSSVLRSPHSNLRELELKDNDLQDSGAKLLSAGLKDPHCKLQSLGLSGCLITEEGCTSLASALNSNPSHLRKLDLSYNYPGDSAVKLLTALQNDPCYKLEELELDHGGECRLKPGPRKYACQLTLDQNTAHRSLSLSENNRKVSESQEEQPYPDHPERFKGLPHVLCREALKERSYWEVEREGMRALIGVAYKSMNRDEGLIGMDDKSFGVLFQRFGYSSCHNGKRNAEIALPHPSTRVGVYLDWAAGTLTFYSVFHDALSQLHTFYSKFTEPLYAAFRVYPESSMTLVPTGIKAVGYL
ncbi:NACHT, LRR and PYD domains-containing protein 12-like [Chanos chanos]|uniref:NACHT, LRR and PYD domains-containing protein 12-like n=1 Tax=Chanos chanos TaxID=29144 RepID=A0A6J2V4P4_CHACN|nr:NACHT, LRR and PYD domains-containing protein 12-like [Chanos chanos]